MTVSVTDVRDFLNKMSDDRIKDEVIEKQLGIALTFIEKNCSVTVSTADKDNAVMVYAAYLSYQAYCTEYERAVGQVPPFMVGHLETLASLSGSLIALTRKGNPEYSCPVAQTESMDVYLTGCSSAGLM